VVTVLTSNCDEIRSEPGVLKTGLAINPDQLDQVNMRRIVSLAWLTIRSFPLLRRLRPTIVHTHTPDMGAAVSLAAHVLRIPIVITLHGSSVGQADLLPAKNRVERLLVWLAHYQRVITVDPSILNEIGRLNRQPPVYMPNAIRPTTRAQPARPRVPNRLLYVGRLEWTKGVDLLLKAFQQLLDSFPDATLHIVGSGGEADVLRRQVPELIRSGQVIFCGAATPAEVSAGMAEASLFVLPSRYEGFPLVLLESWAAGLPIVATSVGAIPSFVRDGVDGVLVKPGDPTALRDGLAHLLSDKDLQVRASAAGLVRIKDDFAIGRSADLLESVYREAVDATVGQR
jgi:glycosyltransferase involved in cell wall biosynthesis